MARAIEPHSACEGFPPTGPTHPYYPQPGKALVSNWDTLIRPT